jgi:hypothetical protein
MATCDFTEKKSQIKKKSLGERERKREREREGEREREREREREERYFKEPDSLPDRENEGERLRK